MKIVATEIIQAQRSDVFKVFADIENACDRISAIDKIELLGDIKWGKGMRWRETRTMMGKAATEEMEFTQFNEPSSYVVEAESHGTHYTSIYTFEEAEDGATQLEWSFEGKPLTLFAKLLSPLGYAFKGSLRKMMQRDVTELKQFLESESK